MNSADLEERWLLTLTDEEFERAQTMHDAHLAESGAYDYLDEGLEV